MPGVASGIPIRISGPVAAEGGPHPVSAGLPIPRGTLKSAGDARLRDASGNDVPCDARPLVSWPDGSVKWLLVRFLARGDSAAGDAEPAYRLYPGPIGATRDEAGRKAAGPQDARDAAPNPAILKIREEAGKFTVETGAAAFILDRTHFRPFFKVTAGGSDLLAPPGKAPHLLVDAGGVGHRFRISSSRVEHAGRVAADILFQGRMEPDSGEALCEASCRITFFAGTALARMDFTLWNPRAARHPGGLWDLGDPGSVFFRSFALPLELAAAGTPSLSLDPSGESVSSPDGLDVRQESSGNPNWASLAHVDGNNKVTPSFRGYRLRAGRETREGFRANPAVLHPGPLRGTGIALAMEGFWQTFPKQIEAAPGRLTASPFPQAEGRVHELQGGERANFAAWVDFAADPERPSAALLPARLPLVAAADPAWCAASGCLPLHIPTADPRTGGGPKDAVATVAASATGDGAGASAATEAEGYFRGLMDAALSGERSFFRRREEWEEFGWRNFGEIAADHERLHYKGTREFVSHYNNQYDLVLAFLAEFLRTGRGGWFELGRDLARHVVHIDIYHTQADRSVYNGGYFWHTAHYLHAGTATHRGFSRLGGEWPGGKAPSHFGGGPSNEHDYATGLALHHCLTGDPDSKEAVLELARWVRDMQEGGQTVFRFLSRNDTGNATSTRDPGFQGPGRGAGYSINTSLDAFSLTGDRAWLDQAERFIRTCIHPGDDPDSLDLLNREDRWSYVVFLQSLGRYLEAKLELAERDDAFAYAHASLIRYARWMAEREYPYLDRPDQLEFPTSTWPAQDLRKAYVFLLAARFGPREEAGRFGERATHFLVRSHAYLRGFDDADSARNLVLIMNHAPLCFQYFRARAEWNLGLPEPVPPSWPKVTLVPQRIQALRNIKAAALTLGLAGLLRFLRFLVRKKRRLR